MQKRPLCLLCICLVFITALLTASGLPLFWQDRIPSSLQTSLKEGCSGKIYGQIYRIEAKDTGNILYLKNSILLVYSNRYSLKNSKITYKNDIPANSLHIGDSVCAQGDVYLPEKASNPGQFDMASYYDRRYISVCMTANRYEITQADTEWIPQLAFRLRTAMTESIGQVLSSGEAGILLTMLLGDKSQMDGDVYSLYQKGGISHILAISGVHISILGAGLYRVLKKLLADKKASYLTCGILFFYLILVEFPISAQRAVYMFFMQSAARLTGRNYDEPTAIAFAAMLILLQNPSYIFDSGFVLSFGAAIILYVLKNADIRKGSFGIWLWLFMLPVTMYYYNELAFGGLILNLLVLPGMGLLLFLGLLGSLLEIVFPLGGRIFLTVAGLMIKSCTFLCGLVTRLPGSSLITGRPYLLQVLAYILLMLLILKWKKKTEKKKRRIAAKGLIFLAAFVLLFFRLPHDFSVTMLDIGQGDCNVIESSAGVMMVDGGSTTKNEVGRYRIVPYLKYRGISRIDAMVLTHPDEDHMNGLTQMLQMIKAGTLSMKVKQFMTPWWMKDSKDWAELRGLCEELEIPIVYLKKGDCFSMGEARIRVIYPALQGDEEGFLENPNTGSLVFRMETEDFSMLFTGDIEGVGEEALLKEKKSLLECDILKVAHHGSKYTSGEEILKMINAKAALISVGIGNWYGHPHGDTLKRLEDAGMRIWRTDQMGALKVGGERGKVYVERYLE